MQQFAHRRLIGVLGGMGPAATIDFLAKIVAATPAGRDQEHVPLLVHDVPQIPDRSAAIAEGSDGPFQPMLAGVRLLERSGVEAIAIPCNTAHFWHDRLAAACRVPILHIADAVADQARAANCEMGAIALLATRGTRMAGIYQRRFEDAFGALLLPNEDDQVLIDHVIAAVKAGDMPRARGLAGEAYERLRAGGAKRLLLACTELPLAFAGERFGAICLDATDALARACVAVSCGQMPAAPAREASADSATAGAA